MLTYDIHVLMGNETAESMATIKCHDTGANFRIYPEILTRISKWRTSTKPYTIPDGSIAILKVKKADETYVLTDAKEVTKDSIYFEPHPQTFTAAGKADAEVNIYGPDMRRITSGTFCLDVSKECADNCDEDSQTYVDVMAEQIQAAIDAAERSESAAKRAEEAAGAEQDGTYAEMKEAIDALEDVCFETVEVESVNKFNPDAVEQTTFSGYACYLSELIPCSVGDVLYFQRLTDGRLSDFSGGIQLVDESGVTALVGLAHYGKYTVEPHVNTPNLVGVRVVVQEKLVPYNSRDTIMVSLNEKPTEFTEYKIGTVEVNRIDGLEEQVVELRETVESLGGGGEIDPPPTPTPAVVASRWTGKNVLVFGDSISTDAYANYTKWATVLQATKGFNLYNYSHHGCGFIRVIENWPQGDMPHQIEIANTKLTAKGVAPDLIILFMGTNDFGAQIPIGKAGDGMDIYSYNKTTYLTPTHEPTALSDLTTFYGGVEHSMARIKQLWPNALVCVLTPLQRLSQTSATAGKALEDYRNIIIKTARMFTYPVKDLYTDANFSPCNPYDRENKTYAVYDSALGRYTYDGLHPTEAFCRDELAPMIGAFIENMSSGVGYISTSEKGEKGDPGDDYVLTEADKTEIAQQAAALIDTSLLSALGSGVIA